MSKKYIVIVILMLQAVLVIFLTYKIFQKLKPVLNVNPVSQDSIQISESSLLEYYWELSPAIIEETDFFWLEDHVSYTINNDTLNESKDYVYKKNDNTYRIITLGDSFTFGQFVNTYNNWTEVLERSLETHKPCGDDINFEIINLGVPGYDIEYAVERYRLRGDKYNPNLIIWFLKDDDFLQVNEWYRHAEEEIKLEMLESGELEELEKKGIPYGYDSELQKIMSDIREDIGYEELIKYQEERLVNIYKYSNSDLVFVTLNDTSDEYKDIMGKIAYNRLDTHYHELDDIYKEKNNSFQPYDFHPSVAGHRIIAEDIYKYLLSSDLISCQ